MQRFEDLDVWRRAFALISPVYRLTALFPRDERFGLTSQMRNGVLSVAANIAEGCGRRTLGEFRNFLSIASGSASELECHMLVCVELGFATDHEIRPLINDLRAIRRMIYALDRTLAVRSNRTRKPREQPKPRPGKQKLSPDVARFPLGEQEPTDD